MGQPSAPSGNSFHDSAHYPKPSFAQNLMRGAANMAGNALSKMPGVDIGGSHYSVGKYGNVKGDRTGAKGTHFEIDKSKAYKRK